MPHIRHVPAPSRLRSSHRAPAPRGRLWAIALTLSLTAGLGGAVWAATPGTTSGSQTPFEVENASVLRATGTPRPASGTHVGMWWNRSTATTTVEGPGRLHFSAIGSYCDGWPLVRVFVDGRLWWQSYVVDAERYGSYSTGPALPEGRHEVRFQLANDRYREGRCDRNLFLADAKVEAPRPGGGATQTPPTATPSTTPAPTMPGPTTPAPTRPTPTRSTPTTPAPTTPTPTTPPPTNPDGGRPGPANTGVPDGTRLRVHQGDLVVKKDGTVIDGLDVRGMIRVDADGVTIKNSLIRGDGSRGPLLAHYEGDRLRVVDTTVRPDARSMYVDGIKGRDIALERVEIANVVDGIQVIGGRVSLESSWIHSHAHFASGVDYQPDGKTHDDSVQVESGSAVFIRNSVLEDADNAALMVTQNAGRVTDLQVIGSWLSGGSCTVNIDDKGRGAITGSTVSNNRFGMSAHHAERCPMLMPRASQIRVSGNVFDGSGDPALPRNR